MNDLKTDKNDATLIELELPISSSKTTLRFYWSIDQMFFWFNGDTSDNHFIPPTLTAVDVKAMVNFERLSTFVFSKSIVDHFSYLPIVTVSGLQFARWHTKIWTL